MGKTILCLCHDVSAADIRRAVRDGYTHPETIKRYTAVFMGPCQGRSCGDLVLDEIAAATGRPRAELHPTTSRPPAYGVRMGALAEGAGSSGASAGAGASEGAGTVATGG